MSEQSLHYFFYICCCGTVEDLIKYLDPQFTDHITVPDAMKLEFILAGKKHLTWINQSSIQIPVSFLIFLAFIICFLYVIVMFNDIYLKFSVFIYISIIYISAQRRNSCFPRLLYWRRSATCSHCWTAPTSEVRFRWRDNK